MRRARKPRKIRQRHGQLRQRDHLVEAVEAQEGEAVAEAEAERVIADEQQNQRPGGGKAAPRAAKHARRVRVAAQVGGDAVQEKEHGHLGEGDTAARHHRAQQGKDHEHHRQQALKLAPVQRIEEAIHVRLEKTEDQITGDKPVCEGGHGRQSPPDLADAEGRGPPPAPTAVSSTDQNSVCIQRRATRRALNECPARKYPLISINRLLPKSPQKAHS